MQKSNLSLDLFSDTQNKMEHPTCSSSSITTATTTSYVTPENDFGRATSVLQHYRRIGFMKDAQETAYCWDFVDVPKRVARISLPKTTTDPNGLTNWVHFKVFRDNVTKLDLHQILILSLFEVRRLLWCLPSIVREAQEKFEEMCNNNSLTDRDMLEESNVTIPQLEYPSPAEDAIKCHHFWTVNESARRMVCMSIIFYDNNDFNRSYFQIKLFSRARMEDSFQRKALVSFRVGEVHRMVDSSTEMLSKIVRESINYNNRNKIGVDYENM